MPKLFKGSHLHYKCKVAMLKRVGYSSCKKNSKDGREPGNQADEISTDMIRNLTKKMVWQSFCIC